MQRRLCAAVIGSTDTAGNVYAAFRYFNPADLTYTYRVYRSTDGGLTWPSSGTGVLGSVSSSYGTRIEMFMTKLASGRMLFGYLVYPDGTLYYRVFDGSSWGSLHSVSSGTTGLPSNAVKHVSSDSDASQNAWVTYPSSWNSGNVMMAQWTNTGTFFTIFASTTGSFWSYSLPRLVINPVDNILRVFAIISPSLGNSAVAEVAPANCVTCSTIYSTGDTGTSPYPNQLVAAVKYPSHMFVQNSGNVNTIKFNGHSYVPAPYSSGVGTVNTGGCDLPGNARCTFWDTSTGKMRNYDAPFPGTGGNTLYTSVEMNTPSPPGNSPVFWRSTDGSVSWGFNYNAIGQLSTATQLDTAAAEGGIGLWRCHAASATSSCDTVYSLVKLINGPAYWNVVPGTSLSVNDPNHTYKESFTQIGGYRYFAAPYASASAHSCGKR